MVEAEIRSIEGEIKGSLTLPSVFETVNRLDLIKRAVLAEQSRKRQPQGRSPTAGKLVTQSSQGPGRGISKIPRTHGKRTHHANRAAYVKSTVGGMLAFPPKVDKKIVEKINKKELRLALWSAVSLTADKATVEARGHLLEEETAFPIVVENAIMEVEKTSEMKEILENLGTGNDLIRSGIKKVRAGKGKMRGRKYRRKVGPLFVVSEDCKAMKAADNLAGVTVLRVRDLSVEDLAPGTHAGRLTIWTESAIKLLEEWN